MQPVSGTARTTRCKYTISLGPRCRRIGSASPFSIVCDASSHLDFVLLFKKSAHLGNRFPVRSDKEVVAVYDSTYWHPAQD
eukprot:41786-Amphidinium_carterae.1